MKTYTMNQVIETLAPVIADKLNLRAVIEYDNDETVLLDFSDCGTPFTDDRIMSWCDQQTVYDEDGEYAGTNELDYGSEKTYLSAFEFILFLLNSKGPKCTDFYVETF